MQNKLTPLEASKKTYSTVLDPVPPPIAPTQSEVYDPTHPDADWAGMVSRTAYTRKHEQGHISQKIGIVHTERGIVSKEEKVEFPRKRRDHVPAAIAENHQIIGGITPSTDPYMTDMRRAELGLKTDDEQLTLAKQQQHRKQAVLQYKRENVIPAANARPSPVAHTAPAPKASHALAFGNNRDFLANLGDALAHDF